MSQRCLSLFSTHAAVTPVAELASMQRLGLPSLASEDAFAPGRDMVSSLFLRSFSVACLYGRRDVGFSPRFWCLEASSGSHGGGLLLKDREEVSSSLTSVRQFAKRAKKWHGGRYGFPLFFVFMEIYAFAARKKLRKYLCSGELWKHVDSLLPGNGTLLILKS